MNHDLKFNATKSRQEYLILRNERFGKVILNQNYCQHNSEPKGHLNLQD